MIESGLKEIVVYGGSFNPPTYAHYCVIKDFLFKKRFDGCKLFIEPVDAHAYDKQLLPYAVRAEMAAIAFAPLQSYGGVVTNFSRTLKVEDKKSTYSFLQALQSFLGRDVKVGLLIGSDQYEDIYKYKWLHSEELRRDFNIYVTPRGDADERDLLMRSSCGHTNHKGVRTEILNPLYEGYRSISSTAVRELLAEGKVEEAKRLLPDGVIEYCMDNKLYKKV